MIIMLGNENDFGFICDFQKVTNLSSIVLGNNVALILKDKGEITQLADAVTEKQ